jgi:hypothetical protein
VLCATLQEPTDCSDSRFENLVEDLRFPLFEQVCTVVGYARGSCPSDHSHLLWIVFEFELFTVRIPEPLVDALELLLRRGADQTYGLHEANHRWAPEWLNSAEIHVGIVPVPHNRGGPETGGLLHVLESVGIETRHLPVYDSNELAVIAGHRSRVFAEQNISRFHVHMAVTYVMIKQGSKILTA